MTPSRFESEASLRYHTALGTVTGRGDGTADTEETLMSESVPPQPLLRPVARTTGCDQS